MSNNILAIEERVNELTTSEKDHVLWGKHLTNPKTEWMASRGNESLVMAAKKCREQEPNSSKVEYTIMTYEKYLESRK